MQSCAWRARDRLSIKPSDGVTSTFLFRMVLRGSNYHLHPAWQGSWRTVGGVWRRAKLRLGEHVIAYI